VAVVSGVISRLGNVTCAPVATQSIGPWVWVIGRLGRPLLVTVEAVDGVTVGAELDVLVGAVTVVVVLSHGFLGVVVLRFKWG